MLYDVVDEALDPEALVRAVLDDASGGLVTFIGYVRATSDDDRAVTGLSYETHRELAIAEMRAIGAEAWERFGTVRVAMVHRVGSLAIGEAAVAIAVAAAHRGPAFDACEFAIDELKRRVPIWKKEHYVSGDARWRENLAPET
ncbi:MAG: molybdenum cofactor biosynthesis protein MoaE [Candidatus Eremiobacteraeota bacterium]|nr:molybdenum cofactor biosynthesis protein MoaE [Candidatus Eremiobacteraeota bacterium]